MRNEDSVSLFYDEEDEKDLKSNLKFKEKLQFLANTNNALKANRKIVNSINGEDIVVINSVDNESELIDIDDSELPTGLWNKKKKKNFSLDLILTIFLFPPFLFRFCKVNKSKSSQLANEKDEVTPDNNEKTEKSERKKEKKTKKEKKHKKGIFIWEMKCSCGFIWLDTPKK